MDPVDEMLLEEVRRRRADPDVDQHDDVLAMLIQARYEDGSQMSDEELRDEIKTLLVAGHDTTTATLTWVFERLLRHPDKLQRIQDELRAGEDSGYIDAVIQETMRLRPSVMAAMRRITEPLELGGYTLPAGTSVYVSIYLTHRRADIYPEPESFRPERFMERAPGTYTWLPFGGGVRRCIGAAFAMYEMRKVIETIVREADLRAVDPRPEGIARGWVTFIPDKGTRVVMNARRRPDTAGAPAQSSTPASTPTSTPA
jgi:cytochrome P450